MGENGTVSTNESSHQSDPAEVSLRRAPRVSVFLVLGAALGLLTALILTSVFPVDENVGFGATFGFLALYLIPIGILVAGFIALVFDWRSRRRARPMTASRIHVSDERDASAGDESEQE